MLIIFDLDDTLYDCTGGIIRNSDGTYNLENITLFSGVKEFLKDSNNNNHKNIKTVLVSMGDSDFQNKKLTILGISELFNKIIICSTDPEKKDCFQQAMEKFPEEKEILIVGNRIDSEIRYGNELGLKTVLINHGKYKNLKAKDSSEIPDLVYLTFQEFVEGLFKDNKN
ncbi:MAG: HAD family hydrolase [archaeon]